MGTRSRDADEERADVTLRVDDRGRITIPKSVRERLGIEPNDRVPAQVRGSVLEIDAEPSARLETATAGRDDWADSTPTDAGESLFGSMETDGDE